MGKGSCGSSKGSGCLGAGNISSISSGSYLSPRGYLSGSAGGTYKIGGNSDSNYSLRSRAESYSGAFGGSGGYSFRAGAVRNYGFNVSGLSKGYFAKGFRYGSGYGQNGSSFRPGLIRCPRCGAFNNGSCASCGI